MTKIYYCKNEDDLKRVAIHIFTEVSEITCCEDGLQYAKICGCDYNTQEESEFNCDCDECLLYDHMEDKDAYKHIELRDIDCEFPCIVCVNDIDYSSDEDEIVMIYSISEAKCNTKYGIKEIF